MTGQTPKSMHNVVHGRVAPAPVVDRFPASVDRVPTPPTKNCAGRATTLAGADLDESQDLGMNRSFILQIHSFRQDLHPQNRGDEASGSFPQQCGFRPCQLRSDGLAKDQGMYGAVLRAGRLAPDTGHPEYTRYLTPQPHGSRLGAGSCGTRTMEGWDG